MNDNTISDSFASVLPSVLFLTVIFFLNFMTRVVLGPVMPLVQADMGFSHAGAGHIFLCIALGNGVGLLISGLVSRRVGHHMTVPISALLLGGCALWAAATTELLPFLGVLFCAGVACGLYLPSGIATISSRTRRQDWGKVFAVHEMAPNLSYLLAPLFAELVVSFSGWRSTLVILGAAQIVLGLVYARYGKGGDFPGVVPSRSAVRMITAEPTFWVFAALFVAAIAVSVGPYSMMTLYLTSEHGFTRPEANSLLAIARTCALPTALLAGVIVDKLGAFKTICMYIVLGGTATILLGVAHGQFLVWATIAQPMTSVIFFVAGFTALSEAFEKEKRSLAISFISPCAAFFGIGGSTTTLGWLGDRGMFGVGFVGIGCALLLCFALLPRLKSALQTSGPR